MIGSSLMRLFATIYFALVILCFAEAMAQDPFASTIRPTEPLTPDQQLKTFQVPDGFKIELFAAEPQIQKPMNMAFDAAGRLWVSGSVEYPFAAAAGKGRDTIRVLEDTDQDGRADKVTTFADGMNIPMGLYPYRDGVVVYSIPNIWFLRDTDGDGKCDERRVLYGPLGEPVDTHGMQNAFRRGFDGWLYICHGFRNESTIRGADGSEVKLQSGNTYRVRLDGSRVEQYSWGQVNPFGSTFLPNGDLVTADCHSKPLTMLLRGGYFSSFGKPHDGLGYVPSIMEHGHGSTAIAGAAIYDGDRFPKPYRGSLYVGNVMTSRVHRDSLVWHGSSLEAHEEEDFLVCDDPWFRPVDLQIGPDGALYIADFYNRIIGHYEVDLNHPGRDRNRGRIWRVAYNADANSSSVASQDLSRASADDLIKALHHSALQVRSLAMDQLSDRVGSSALPLLSNALKSETSVEGKAHSLWTLFRLQEITDSQITRAASDSSPLVRQHAMRIISELAAPSRKVLQLAVQGLTDTDALVRRAAADAIGRHPDPSNIAPLLTALSTTPKEDVHLKHTIMIALKSQLQREDAFSAVQPLTLASPEKELLGRIALAVPTTASAEFLLESIKNGVADAEQLMPQLVHIVSYASADSLDQVVELVKLRAANQLDLQVELIQLLQQQLTQRGVKANSAVHEWGRRLAEQLLDEPEVSAQSWSTIGNENTWGFETRQCEDGARGVRFLSSMPGGERATGTIRSASFELPAALSFYLCGHLGFPKDAADPRNSVRLRLEQTDEVIRSALPPRHDVARQVQWLLGDVAGKRGYLEIVDGLDIQAYAWLAVSRFDPAVIKLPSVVPAVTTKRQVAAAQIASLLKMDDLTPQLTKLATSRSTSIDARTACIETLVSFSSDPISRALLVPLRDSSVALSLRNRIADQLCDRRESNMDELLGDVLKSVPARIQTQIGEQLATSVPGTELLLQMVAAGSISPRILQRPSVLRSITSSDNPAFERSVAELTAGLAPKNEEIEKLVASRIQGFAKSAKSVAEGKLGEGKLLFTKHCAACHQLAGTGGLVGPQLDGIGNRGLERIAEDLLDPNRNIDAAFHVTVVATNDGRIVSGLFRRKEGKAKVYAGKDGKEFRLLADEIDVEQTSRTSIMPDNFGSVLTEQECYELLGYLESLRTPHKPAADAK